jgi:NitT/TauT family transport system ATP-binding protein
MINVKGLSVTYKTTDQLVIDCVDFSVKKGEVVALVGPSGSGKTTLLNALAGLLNDKDVYVTGSLKISPKAKTNVVFQEPRLLPWRNVLGNVAFGLEAKKTSKEKAQEISRNYLALVGLEDYKDYYPKQISIGMQQRVNFARALSCHPDILLLDEPFSALDVDTKKKLQKDFLSIIKKKKITSVFVTHDLDEALFLAERIIVLTKGPAKIEKIFTKSELSKIPDDLRVDFDPYGGN